MKNSATFHVEHRPERESVFYRAAIGLAALGCWKLVASGGFFVEPEYAPVVRSWHSSIVRAFALAPEMTRFARDLYAGNGGLVFLGNREHHRQIEAR